MFADDVLLPVQKGGITSRPPTSGSGVVKVLFVFLLSIGFCFNTTVALATVITATAPTTPGWKRAAVEGQTFSLSSAQPIRFGIGTKWVEKTASGQISCSVAFFENRDPAVGSNKECWIPTTVTASAPTSPGWTKIASEGQTFSLSSAQPVRYGAGSSWLEMTTSGQVACSNAYFGRDPLSGTSKECWIPAAVTTVSAPTSPSWTRVALEGQAFSLSSTQPIRYGYGSSWIEKSGGGQITCANTFFNYDPAPGVNKECWVPVSTSTSVSAPTSPTWTRMAYEDQTFTLSSLQPVRYGYGTKWLDKSVSGQVTCSNTFFGSDPNPGVTKECWTLTNSTTPPPPSPGGCRGGVAGHVAPSCEKNAYLGLGFGDTQAWAQALGRTSIDIQEQWNDTPLDRVGSDSQWNFMENIFSVQQYIVQDGWKGKLSFAQPMWAGGAKDSNGNISSTGEGPVGCLSAANKQHMLNVLNALKAVRDDAYIRLGWEFNGNWYQNQNAWSVPSSDMATYKANWKKCWIAWYDAAKSVSPKFKLVWNPNWANKGTCYNPDFDIRDFWPGAEYVDAAGPDQYDGNCNGVPQDPNKKGPYGEPVGISAWADFAISQGVPFAVPEWGIQNDQWGSGDRAQFIIDMYNAFKKAYASPSGLAYQSYFDGDRDNFGCKFALLNTQCTGVNPNAKAKYFELFRVWPPK